mgnify:CR=1 FL=1
MIRFKVNDKVRLQKWDSKTLPADHYIKFIGCGAVGTVIEVLIDETYFVTFGIINPSSGRDKWEIYDSELEPFQEGGAAIDAAKEERK